MELKLIQLVCLILCCFVSYASPVEKCKKCEDKVSELQNVLKVFTKEVTTKVTIQPAVHFVFPNATSEPNYVKYLGYVPGFSKAATMCVWVEFGDLSEISPIASCLTKDKTTHFLLEVKPPNSLVLNMYGYTLDIPATFETAKPYHFCFWFDAENKHFGFNCNGRKLLHRPYVSSEAPSGPDFILGMYETDSGEGAIGGVTSYGRVLTQEEMDRMAFSCLNPADFALSWDLTKSEIHGAVTYKTSSLCPYKLVQSFCPL